MIQLRNIIFALIYNCTNLALLAIFMKEATIIRSDGPGGFGEMILKNIILLPTLALFFASLISSIRIHFNKEHRPVSKGFCAFATSWLIFFAIIAIWEACSDDKGYCRNWSLYIVN